MSTAVTTHRLSLLAWVLGAALLLGTAFFYYPKWQKEGYEATLSWDVSGYYFYLPALFIYHDVRELGFRDSILAKYQPTPVLQQAFQHPSGHFVLKYSAGQALQMLPWFTLGHIAAHLLGYPTDGFSKPYQTAISWGSLLVALLGLWFTRKNLLHYFSDAVTALTLLILAFGTNYLNYTAIDGAMTHNWLFTLYALLIWATIRFYETPNIRWALLIGLLCGWATLTRPTEVLSALIPLLWGVRWREMGARLSFLQNHSRLVVVAAVVAAAVAGLQALYWKYSTGEWLVYSYEDQTFSWLRPHLHDGLLSFRAGWLVYTPLMGLALVGLWPLRRQQPTVLPAVLVFGLLFMYVCWAWDIWWYGGSLGQRSMVQSYAVWVFPLAATVAWVHAQRSQVLQTAFAVLLLVGIWHNVWWLNQAHRGDGWFVPEQMTKAYYLRAMRLQPFVREDLKLLDTKEYFVGTARRNVTQMYYNDFEQPNAEGTVTDAPLNGTQSLLLNGERQWSPTYVVPFSWPDTHAGRAWLRATCTFQCTEREGEFWQMTQMVVRFYAGEKRLKERMIRLQRHVDGSEKKTVFIDVPMPARAFDRVELAFWNAESSKTVRIDDIGLEWFDE